MQSIKSKTKKNHKPPIGKTATIYFIFLWRCRQKCRQGFVRGLMYTVTSLIQLSFHYKEQGIGQNWVNCLKKRDCGNWYQDYVSHTYTLLRQCDTLSLYLSTGSCVLPYMAQTPCCDLWSPPWSCSPLSLFPQFLPVTFSLLPPSNAWKSPALLRGYCTVFLPDFPVCPTTLMQCHLPLLHQILPQASAFPESFWNTDQTWPNRLTYLSV